MHPDEALADEALRIYRRYMVEFVEAFGLCPWAEKARRDGNVRERVVVHRGVDLAPALDAVDDLSRDAAVHVGLVIFPRLRLARLDFERFVADLREADAARTDGGSPEMAMAAFHPDARPDFGAAHRMVLYVRASPDPTIQLVRRSVLDAVRKPHDQGTGYVDLASVNLHELLRTAPKPPLHERVAQANLETLERVGIARVEAVLEDIRRDRDRSYAALGEEPRWSGS